MFKLTATHSSRYWLAHSPSAIAVVMLEQLKTRPSCLIRHEVEVLVTHAIEVNTATSVDGRSVPIRCALSAALVYTKTTGSPYIVLNVSRA